MMSEVLNKEGQAAGNTQPEVNGTATGGKTFTQDEVNRIVSDRLSKERASQGNAAEQLEQLNQREAALNAREAKLTCTEYIKAANLPEGLMEVFDTSNADQFKASVGKLLELYPQINPNTTVPTFTIGSAGGHTSGADPFAEAFRRK